jgi:hypothetical protein
MSRSGECNEAIEIREVGETIMVSGKSCFIDNIVPGREYA